MPNEAHLKSLLTGIAHDLRGSLGASASLAKMLKNRHINTLDERALKWLDMISTEYSTSKRKLLGISSMADLFDYSVQTAPCSLAEIVGKAMLETKSFLASDEHDSTQLMFDIQCDTYNLATIVTSYELITLFINELFLNSAAHASPTQPARRDADNTPVIIKSEFRYVAKDNSFLLLYVDNGHLLTTKDIEYIQTPFNTLKNSRSAAQSAGLGLSKLARIAELLNATLIFDIGTKQYTGLQISLEIPKV